MKIFVLGVPHTITSPEFSTCAFTMKTFNLCRMLTRAGNQVIHLGVEGSNPECTEHVDIVTHDYWAKFFKHPGTAFYDCNVTPQNEEYHKRWTKNASIEIRKRIDDDWESIICCTWNGTQRNVVNEFPRQYVVESGIGYLHGQFAQFRVFESHAWMHYTRGMEHIPNDQRWYWTVIPNAFDQTMFEYREKRGEDFLFMGRLNDDKGVQIAIDASKAAKRKITICGQGDPTRFLKHNWVTYHAPAGIEERRRLMAEAKAVFCPSWYTEPFCGVSIEAQMSGAPVICSNHGAFPENVLHGITGYRCQTMNQFCQAAIEIDKIVPRMCREWAENFTLEAVAPQYSEYFTQVLGLHNGKDWNHFEPGTARLDVTKREYPQPMVCVTSNGIMQL
jgi:glycosyltransferase involved in cell wall biosynthesis